MVRLRLRRIGSFGSSSVEEETSTKDSGIVRLVTVKDFDFSFKCHVWVPTLLIPPVFLRGSLGCWGSEGGSRGDPEVFFIKEGFGVQSDIFTNRTSQQTLNLF